MKWWVQYSHSHQQEYKYILNKIKSMNLINKTFAVKHGARVSRVCLDFAHTLCSDVIVNGARGGAAHWASFQQLVPVLDPENTVLHKLFPNKTEGIQAWGLLVSHQVESIGSRFPHLWVFSVSMLIWIKGSWQPWPEPESFRPITIYVLGAWVNDMLVNTAANLKKLIVNVMELQQNNKSSYCEYHKKQTWSFTV